MTEQEFEEIEIDPEEEKLILEMSCDPEIYEKIRGSIAPSIYGYDDVKEALALQLVSGFEKHLPDGARIRGDIHILLVGDPGIAKSQLLRYMTKISPRGIYTSGKSSTSAGLTATAVKDELGDGRWTIEAGALVLADKGIAAIDEMDKMNNEDKSALHEAMEQQSYHPLTEIQLSDGRKVRIGEFVDRLMKSRQRRDNSGKGLRDTASARRDQSTEHRHESRLRASRGQGEQASCSRPLHPNQVFQWPADIWSPRSIRCISRKRGSRACPPARSKAGDLAPAPRSLPIIDKVGQLFIAG